MGVEVKSTKPGDGKTYPKHGDVLVMHYVGRFASNNEQFDSSYDRGKPIQFVVGIGSVIKGWDEGAMKLSLGEKATLIVSSDYGYGEEGQGDTVPPNSDLIFDVELVGINDKKASSGGCIIQ